MASRKNRLEHSIYQVLTHNRDGSHNTQMKRKCTLRQMASELHEEGYKLSDIRNLKQKHVLCLNARWKANGQTNETIRNKNAFLRWMSEKIDKRNVVPSNDDLGVIGKTSKDNVDKSVNLEKADLSKITDKRIYVQIHLQRYLGLRREESCKLKPHMADRGDKVYLYKSWCKGGRERFVPITSKEARYWLDEAKKLIPNKNESMIPPDKKYITHRHLYDKQTSRAGIKHRHGLRHAYAQERYKKLTGWECPVKGGPSYRKLTSEQKEIDYEVRLKISLELGHSRINIVSTYVGR